MDYQEEKYLAHFENPDWQQPPSLYSQPVRTKPPRIDPVIISPTYQKLIKQLEVQADIYPDALTYGD